VGPLRLDLLHIQPVFGVLFLPPQLVVTRCPFPVLWNFHITKYSVRRLAYFAFICETENCKVHLFVYLSWASTAWRVVASMKLGQTVIGSCLTGLLVFFRRASIVVRSEERRLHDCPFPLSSF